MAFFDVDTEEDAEDERSRKSGQLSEIGKHAGPNRKDSTKTAQAPPIMDISMGP